MVDYIRLEGGVLIQFKFEIYLLDFLYDNIKMVYECEKCGLSFTRTYSLNRHREQSCVARFNNDGGAKRCRIDGAASTSNNTPVMVTCGVCNVTVPQNRMMAHERTLEHRSKSCVPVSRGVHRIESAFKSRIVTYRVNSDNEHINYTSFFDEIKCKVLGVLHEILHTHKSIKVNMVVVGRYFLATQEVSAEKSFNTRNQIVTLGSDLDDMYGSFVEMMKAQASDFQEKDSGVYNT